MGRDQRPLTGFGEHNTLGDGVTHFCCVSPYPGCTRNTALASAYRLSNICRILEGFNALTKGLTNLLQDPPELACRESHRALSLHRADTSEATHCRGKFNTSMLLATLEAGSS